VWKKGKENAKLSRTNKDRIQIKGKLIFTQKSSLKPSKKGKDTKGAEDSGVTPGALVE